MYQNYNVPYRVNQQNDERLVGSFLGPFLLGGITGGVVAPYFWGGRPNYNNNYYYPYPAPYYPYYPYYRYQR